MTSRPYPVTIDGFGLTDPAQFDVTAAQARQCIEGEVAFYRRS